MCYSETLLCTEVVAEFKGKELGRFKFSCRKILQEAQLYYVGYLLKTLTIICLGVS